MCSRVAALVPSGRDAESQGKCQMVQRKFFAVSAGALVLALIGSLGAPRSLAATAVKMERIAAVHHLHVYTVTPGYAARRRRQLTDGEEGRYGFCPRRSRCQATFSCPVAEFSASHATYRRARAPTSIATSQRRTKSARACHDRPTQSQDSLRACPRESCVPLAVAATGLVVSLFTLDPWIARPFNSGALSGVWLLLPNGASAP